MYARVYQQIVDAGLYVEIEPRWQDASGTIVLKGLWLRLSSYTQINAPRNVPSTSET